LLDEIKDAGLNLNVSKTVIFPKGLSQETAFDVAQNISLASFVSLCFIGIGVPHGDECFCTHVGQLSTSSIIAVVACTQCEQWVRELKKEKKN
jgi:hypothetical protein